MQGKFIGLVLVGAFCAGALFALLAYSELTVRRVPGLNTVPDIRDATPAAALSAPPPDALLKTDTEPLPSGPQRVIEEPPYSKTDSPPSSTLPQKPVRASGSTTTISRTENPYTFPPLSIQQLDEAARAALVNILCESGSRFLRSTSGSGVIIDSRGVILTNAHVAQYFLLENSPEAPMSCIIRAGSPARSAWRAQLLYVPARWIEENARDILEPHPLGTGEHDYALLYIYEALDGTPLPKSFPALPFDLREATGFTGDQVLAAAYPAEFVKGAAARNDLYITSTIAQIRQMLTFSERLVDVISLGGTVVAQGGSSGGAVVNLWGYLIGLMVTTSEGDTTAMRDLRAITMAHIDRSFTLHTGKDLREFLEGDPAILAKNFATNAAPTLSQILANAIAKGSR